MRRSLILAAVTAALSCSAATAWTKKDTVRVLAAQQEHVEPLDVVGVYAVINSYIKYCSSREDPLPLDKMLAVAAAARIMGMDITSYAFKGEAARRESNLDVVMLMVGRRRWCEVAIEQVNKDFDQISVLFGAVGFPETK